jgi:hypothetical protein
MLRLVCGLVAMAAAISCAPIHPPAPTTSHPSSPEAKQGHDPQRLNVLVVNEADLPQTPPEMRRGRMRHGSGRMDEGNHDRTSRPAGQTEDFTCPMPRPRRPCWKPASNSTP